MPASALHTYARWWQLETYLREVAYTELRCAYGKEWVEHLGEGAAIRAERDRVNDYMPSADDEELLAYTGVAKLFEMIEEHWELFEKVLPPQRRWAGTVDELEAIRHRNAHCRRPHADDLARLEQALRNLEPGALEFYGFYTGTLFPDGKSKDPLVRDWVGERHEAAARLIEHCRRNYDVQFRLRYSRRPWAGKVEKELSGKRGVLWQAQWLLGPGLAPLEFWKELNPNVRDLIVHMLFDDVSVTATFAAVDESEAIADAIGHIFDTLIPVSRRSQRLAPDTYEAVLASRAKEAEGCRRRHS